MIQNQLISILQAASYENASIDTSSKVDSAIVMVESFTRSVECSASLRQTLLQSLSTNAVADHLSRFLDLSLAARQETLSNEHNNTCLYTYASRRGKLQRNICTLFLKMAVLSQQETTSLDVSLGSALLDRKWVLDLKTPACQGYPKYNCTRASPLVPLFETGSTPQSMGSSSEWRERIKKDLAQNAEYQYQTIVRNMAETCQELERRCNEVERPLRDEQTKSRQLHDSLEASKMLVAELEAHGQEQSLFLEGIEREKSELTEQVRALENDRDELSGQVDALREALQEATQEAEHALQSGADKVKELELIHAAVIAEKDETLEAQHRLGLDTRARVESVEGAAAGLRTEAAENAKQLALLVAALSEQRTALDQANLMIQENQDESNKQEQEIARLEDERSDLQSQVTLQEHHATLLLTPTRCRTCPTPVELRETTSKPKPRPSKLNRLS